MQKQKLKHLIDIPSYYNCAKGKFNNYKGIYYWLSYKLTDSEKQELSDKYNNIVFLISRNEYAPEITRSVLFVANTIIKDSNSKAIKKAIDGVRKKHGLIIN